MSQGAFIDEEAFFEVASNTEAPEPVDIPIDQPLSDDAADQAAPHQKAHQTKPISAVFFAQPPETAVYKAAPAQTAVNKVISIANAALNVVQLNEEADSKADRHEWVTLDSGHIAKGSHTMHALKNEHADDRFREPTTSVVNIVKSDDAETPDTEALTASDVRSEAQDVSSPSSNGGEKQTVKSRIVPSIETPSFQASVVEGETSSEERIVVLIGRIDHEQILQLENFLNHVIQKNTTNLYCDVAGLTSINSSGWGLLVAEMQRLRKRGGNLFLCGLQGTVDHSFKVLELDKLFLTFRTVSEAMRSSSFDPGNIRPFPKTKIQEEQSPDNPAYLSLEEKIQRIVAENPLQSTGSIRKILASDAYGKTKISGWALVSKLRSMGLGTKEERYRFFRSS